jgi:hypothetical protein
VKQGILTNRESKEIRISHFLFLIIQKAAKKRLRRKIYRKRSPAKAGTQNIAGLIYIERHESKRTAITSK